jgi:hypothetical protein
MAFSRDELEQLWETFLELGPPPPRSVRFNTMEKALKAHLKKLRQESKPAKKSTRDRHNLHPSSPSARPSSSSIISILPVTATEISAGTVATLPDTATASSLPSSALLPPSHGGTSLPYTTSTLIASTVTPDASTGKSTSTLESLTTISSIQLSPPKAFPKHRLYTFFSPRCFYRTIVHNIVPEIVKEKIRWIYKYLTSRPGQSSVWPQRVRRPSDKKGKDEDIINILPNEAAEEEMEESELIKFLDRMWEGEYWRSTYNGKGKEPIRFHPEESMEVRESEPIVFRDRMWESEYRRCKQKGKGKEPTRFHPEESVEEEERISEIDAEFLEYDGENEDWDNRIWNAMKPEIIETPPSPIDINDEGFQAFVKSVNDFAEKVKEGASLPEIDERIYSGEILA